ncbi:PREDICTED: protein FAM162A-like isoform X2 [Dufourea novaeangliae]|nr:PREDICTED: protein FAM162A-like isoform X2 [Dufourea novaeangliae]XP_015436667.1 PREDICTED: protein FAM162A-like isoform X2 [Dufourea novaeangliae]
MLCARFIRQFKLPIIRRLNSNSMKDNKPVNNNKTSEPIPEQLEESVIGTQMHYVTNFDRRVLVWMKRYPSMDQVPRRVAWSTMQQANTRARIRICNYMIVVVIIGFIISCMSGKKEAAGGRHIISDRMNWYNEVREKGRIEREAKAAAEAAEAAAKT